MAKLSTPEFDRVTQAIVRLRDLGGRGVLVPGNLIVTAAHCIGWDTSGGLTLYGDDYREAVEAADGRVFKVTPLAVEPVADIAILGAVDSQRSPDEAEAFENFCRTTQPVRLAIEHIDPSKPFGAFVFTHDKGVIPIEVQRMVLDDPGLRIRAEVRIEGGASGSPVVTERGSLLAVVSNVSFVESDAGCVGPIALVHQSAPVWLVRRMVDSTIRELLDKALPMR